MTYVPVHHQKPLYLCLSPFDTLGGEPPSRQMIGNYTPPPAGIGERWFVLRPPLGETYEIHNLHVSIYKSEASDVVMDSRGYGTISSAIKSTELGMRVIVVESDGSDALSEIVDFTVGGQIKVFEHWDWARFGFESIEDFAFRFATPAAWDGLEFKFPVTERFGSPILLRGNRGAQLIVKASKTNFSDLGVSPRQLGEHFVTARGLVHSDLVSGFRLSLQAPDDAGAEPIE